MIKYCVQYVFPAMYATDNGYHHRWVLLTMGMGMMVLQTMAPMANGLLNINDGKEERGIE